MGSQDGLGVAAAYYQRHHRAGEVLGEGGARGQGLFRNLRGNGELSTVCAIIYNGAGFLGFFHHLDIVACVGGWVCDVLAEAVGHCASRE